MNAIFIPVSTTEPCSRIYTHTHYHILSLSYEHTHTHTLSLSLSLSLCLSLSLSLIHTHSVSSAAMKTSIGWWYWFRSWGNITTHPAYPNNYWLGHQALLDLCYSLVIPDLCGCRFCLILEHLDVFPFFCWWQGEFCLQCRCGICKKQNKKTSRSDFNGNIYR